MAALPDVAELLFTHTTFTVFSSDEEEADAVLGSVMAEIGLETEGKFAAAGVVPASGPAARAPAGRAKDAEPTDAEVDAVFAQLGIET